MRLLTQCGECELQYDATGWEIGSTFHCHCGALVRVAPPAKHDAAVVRCSSCGAPRVGDELACRFCESEFTLHERDLHSMCPRCLTRLTTKAKFCHHCSTAITPTASSAEVSDLPCPSCDGGPKLVSRRLGQEGATVLECGHCAGIWLGHGAFNVLSQRAENEFQNSGAGIDWRSFPESDYDENWRYRNCPQCAVPMVRRNYGRKSGVMIDSCGDHGIWFDHTELEMVLKWIRAGGLAEAGKSNARSLRRRGTPLGLTRSSSDATFVDELSQILFY